MPLVNPLDMLQSARRWILRGAFNLVDYLTMRAIVEAAEAQRSPVILQTSSATVRQLGIKPLAAMAHLVADASVPVALHLDHGTDRG